MTTYKLTPADLELAQCLENSMPNFFLLPQVELLADARHRNRVFFRSIAPKYGFDPETAKFAGDRDNPSWDVEAEPATTHADFDEIIRNT